MGTPVQSEHGPVVQRIEHHRPKVGVGGSIPSRVTIVGYTTIGYAVAYPIFSIAHCWNKCTGCFNETTYVALGI